MNYLQLVLDATKPWFLPSGKHLSDSDPSMRKVSVCYSVLRYEGGKLCLFFFLCYLQWLQRALLGSWEEENGFYLDFFFFG